MRARSFKITIYAVLTGVVLTFAGCGSDEPGSDITVSEGDVQVIDSTGLAEAGNNGGQDYLFEVVAESDGDTSASDDRTGEDSGAAQSEDSGTKDDEAGTADDKPETDDTGDNTDPEKSEEETGEAAEEAVAAVVSVTPGSKEQIALNPGWQYAEFSKINSGTAVLYRAADNRKNVVIAVNAGHGTKGGQSVKTYCHPDMSPKVTGGSTASGSIEAAAVSGGMSFNNGSSEAAVNLRTAELFRDRLLSKGYDVLMIRDGSDVQLDNIARTVIANNTAACHIAIHFDGDGLSYDKGCFYASVPEALKSMEPVASHWQGHESLGASLISGLSEAGCKINGGGKMAIDLTQTSYSTIPSVDIELGNQASATDDASLSKLADGLLRGIEKIY